MGVDTTPCSLYQKNHEEELRYIAATEPTTAETGKNFLSHRLWAIIIIIIIILS